MNGPLVAPRSYFGVRAAGSVVELETRFWAQGRAGGGVRGDVVAFTGASRRRLFKALAAINWTLLGPALFVTLTYPAEWPSDGRLVKEHLDSLHKRLDRRFGEVRGCWKLEYQRRGAPHLHLALVAPRGVRCVCGARAGKRACRCLDPFRQQLARDWFGIVGSGDSRHLAAGTQVAWLQDHPAGYFAGYVGSRRGKGSQEVVPAGVQHSGRFWGFWRLAPEWRDREISRSDFVQLRRLVRSWKRSQGQRVHVYGRLQGEWVHVRGRSASVLLYQLTRALPGGAVVV